MRLRLVFIAKDIESRAGRFDDREWESLEQSVKLEGGQKNIKHLISCKILTANSFARYN